MLGAALSVKDMGMVESIHLCVLHWAVGRLYGRIQGRVAEKPARPTDD